MATQDVRFADVEASPRLPDGLPRRGMSTVAALSSVLLHENHRESGSWSQTYRHGIPDEDLAEITPRGSTGTTVTFLTDVAGPTDLKEKDAGHFRWLTMRWHDETVEEIDSEPVLDRPSLAEVEEFFDSGAPETRAVWLRLTRMGVEPESLTADQLVDARLCLGWVSAVRQRGDDETYLQRYTRRRPGSRWSQLNIAKVERVTAEGRMRPGGLAEVRGSSGGRPLGHPSRRTVRVLVAATPASDSAAPGRTHRQPGLRPGPASGSARPAWRAHRPCPGP